VLVLVLVLVLKLLLAAGVQFTLARITWHVCPVKRSMRQTVPFPLTY